MEKQNEKLLYESLEYLFEKWPIYDLSNNSIKRACNVLVNLFNYKNLVKVWIDNIGKEQIFINAPYIRVLNLKNININDTIVAGTSGFNNSVGSISIRFNSNENLPAYKIIESEYLSLKNYFTRPCLINGGIVYSREQIIRKLNEIIDSMTFDPQTNGLKGFSDIDVFRVQIGNQTLPIKLILDYGLELANSEFFKRLYEILAIRYCAYAPSFSIVKTEELGINQEEEMIADFKKNFWEIHLELKELLDLTDQASFEKNVPFIHDSLCLIIKYISEKEYHLVGLLLIQLRHLIFDIKTVKEFDKAKFSSFKKNDIKHKTISYFGYRFELHVWSFLIQNKILFEKRESPDFKILNHSVFLEATSCRRNNNSIIYDNFRKVKETINAKLKKGYLNNSTALLIDITNLYHADSKVNFQSDFQIELLNNLKIYLKEFEIGSVLLFTFFLVKYPLQYQSVYTRIDNDSIDNNLNDFLNNYFPMGNIEFLDIAIPNENL